MRHFCFLISLAFSFAFGGILAHAVSPADLSALDRLECFNENSLIESEHDMVVVALMPVDSAVLSLQGPDLTYHVGPSFRGRLIASDLSALDAEVMRPPESYPPVLRLTFGRFDLDRPARKRAFGAAVNDLRRRVPGIQLRCWFDVARWAAARLCTEAL